MHSRTDHTDHTDNNRLRDKREPTICKNLRRPRRFSLTTARHSRTLNSRGSFNAERGGFAKERSAAKPSEAATELNSLPRNYFYKWLMWDTRLDIAFVKN